MAGALIAVALIGCSTSGAAPNANACDSGAAYLGTCQWQTASVNQTVQCNDAVSVDPDGGQVSFAMPFPFMASGNVFISAQPGLTYTAASDEGDFLQVQDPSGVTWGAGWVPSSGEPVMMGTLVVQVASITDCGEALGAEIGGLHGSLQATLVHVDSPSDGASASLTATF
jgi:hypothetical protein